MRMYKPTQVYNKSGKQDDRRLKRTSTHNDETNKSISWNKGEKIDSLTVPSPGQYGYETSGISYLFHQITNIFWNKKEKSYKGDERMKKDRDKEETVLHNGK